MDEIRIVRGAPTDEEVAAVVSALLARQSPTPRAQQPVSRWARAARPVRSAVTERGPGAWRAAALPHSG